jgi:hypothetical protein
MPHRLTAKLLDAQSLLNSAGVIGPSELVNAIALRAYAVFGAGTSAGAVLVEGAHDPTYTGVWALLATLTWTGAASTVMSAPLTGPHLAVRMRIGTAIVGGTVDGYVVVN